MSAFNNLIEQVALKEKLVKVQLKTDPAYSNLGTISKFQGYIGYILRENRTSSKVFLEQNGAVVIVPNKMIEPVQNKLSKVDRFKLAALRYLKEKRDIKQTDILTKLIINCNSIDYVESFCIDNGCTQDDIKNIYKLAFTSTVKEAFSWATVAKNAGGLLKTGINAAAKIAVGADPSEGWSQFLPTGSKDKDKDSYKIPGKILDYIKVVKEKNKGEDKPESGIEPLMNDEVQKICDNIEREHWGKAKKTNNSELISAYLIAINDYR